MAPRCTGPGRIRSRIFLRQRAVGTVCLTVGHPAAARMRWSRTLGAWLCLSWLLGEAQALLPLALSLCQAIPQALVRLSAPSQLQLSSRAVQRSSHRAGGDCRMSSTDSTKRKAQPARESRQHARAHLRPPGPPPRAVQHAEAAELRHAGGRSWSPALGPFRPWGTMRIPFSTDCLPANAASARSRDLIPRASSRGSRPRCATSIRRSTGRTRRMPSGARRPSAPVPLESSRELQPGRAAAPQARPVHPFRDGGGGRRVGRRRA